MGSHAKDDSKLVKDFLCSLSRPQESLFQGWSLKKCKRPQAHLNVRVLIGWGFCSTNHSRGHIWADFRLGKQAALWLVRMILHACKLRAFGIFWMITLGKVIPTARKVNMKSSVSTLACVTMIFRYFNQYLIIYWVKNRISHIFPSPGGVPFLTVILTIKPARLLSPRKSLHIFETNIWVKWFNHIHYKKHRKNCECCPGHYLIVDHYSSI